MKETLNTTKSNKMSHVFCNEKKKKKNKNKKKKKEKKKKKKKKFKKNF